MTFWFQFVLLWLEIEICSCQIHDCDVSEFQNVKPRNDRFQTIMVSFFTTGRCSVPTFILSYVILDRVYQSGSYQHALHEFKINYSDEE